MSDRKFTEEQLSAIETRGKSLLVSAAAGSGKTATLIERIIQSVLSKNEPEDINKILIVTFTNAATSEIKERISQALEAAIEKEPENQRLLDQLTLLPTAKIFTIDGFCNDILRRNSDRADIPPNYRIAETAEAEILSYSLLEAMINSIYEDDMPHLTSADRFACFAEALTSSRQNAALEELFLKLYEKSKTAPEGVGIFRKLSEEYKMSSPRDNQYTKYAKEVLNKTVKHYIKTFRTLSLELNSDADNKSQGYAEVLLSDISICESLIEAKTIFDVKKIIDSINYAKLPSVGNKTAAQSESYNIRNNFKAEIKKLSENFFFYSEDEWDTLYVSLHENLSILADFLETFDSIYTQEKKKRAILEYSDIERYTYNILYKNGEPSDIAFALQQEYSSVYIDEYQDVNELQNKIFEAISRKDNRFMVGDIKQSIYGFRNAKPDIFADMKKSFPPLSESGDVDSASIFMSKNFRSDKNVTDFINDIFDTIFERAGESIGYLPSDRLIHAKSKDEGDLLPESGFTLISPADDSEEDDEEPKSAKDTECKTIAQEIHRLLTEEGSTLRPSDIAIVLRNRTKMSDYSSALAELGVPAEQNDNKNFFLNSDVLLALSLLNSIDNPQKDIYLTALMASPIFDFSKDELYLIRRGREGSLYSSLKEYCDENPSYIKGRAFLEKLSFYRTLSEGMNIEDFMLRIYNDTGIISLAEANGGAENLLMLFSYAKRFSASNFKGLYNFIKFINNIIDHETKFDAKKEENENAAVTITTIHSSKGLEYPIVFYADCGSRLSYKESSDRIIFSEGFGLSMRLRTDGGLALVDNPIQNILIHRETIRYLEEELRIMYVALTRARSRIYVYACIPKNYEDYLEKISLSRRFLDSHSIYSLKTPIALMLTAKSDAKISLIKCGEKENDEKQAAEKLDEIYTAKERELTLPPLDEFRKRFEFKYPFELLTTIPEKLSISKLSPDVLDGVEDDPCEFSIDCTAEKTKRLGILPEFFSGTKTDESAKRGIATHYFMQFFDMKRLEKSTAEAELAKLINDGYISSDVGEMVRLSEIEKFKKSKLFREMKLASRLYREFRFNTRLPAAIFTENEEKKRTLGDKTILVQGVIDCLIEDSDGELHLVDYKTDRLTPNEMKDISVAEEKINQRHSLQLNYYSVAVEAIFGKTPVEMKVYSLPLGDCINIKKLKL